MRRPRNPAGAPVGRRAPDRRRAAPAGPVSPAALPTLEELERAHIELVLRTTNGHRGQAAEILGISERNLYRKLREYQLVPQGPDDGPEGV